MLFLLPLLLACGGSERPPPQPVATPPADCRGAVASTLPGVTLRFPEQPCQLTLAQARSHQFRYEILVDESPGPLTHTQLHRCVGLAPHGFHAAERVQGGDHRYELVDRGRCRPQALSSTPSVGSHPGSLDWDGVSWFGPSDFGNPKGPPFPAGDYTFEVQLEGVLADGTPWAMTGIWPLSLSEDGTRPVPSTPALHAPVQQQPPPPVAPAEPLPPPPPSTEPRELPIPKPGALGLDALRSTPAAPADVAGAAARACQQSSDCIIDCTGSCCADQCGCTMAVNKASLPRAKAWRATACAEVRCPAVGCAFEPASHAVCVEGRCVAKEGL